MVIHVDCPRTVNASFEVLFELSSLLHQQTSCSITIIIINDNYCPSPSQASTSARVRTRIQKRQAIVALVY